MPLSGRDFNSLLNVTPGVQHRPGGGFQGVNISGARTSSNNFMIDGISNNDRYYGDTVMNQTGVVGVPATLVPMDAIGDFTVQQTPSAEFGVKGGAAINIVMKSGGNTPHGTGYYFRHDDWTDSPNFFVKRAAQRRARRRRDADQEPAVRRHVRRPDSEGQDVLLRLLRGPAPGRDLAVRRARADGRQISQARARIAAAGLQRQPDRREPAEVLPDRSDRQPERQRAEHLEHEHVLGEGRSQAEREQPDQRARVLRPQLPVGAGRQQRRNRSAERTRSTCSTRSTDPTIASLAGVVWNSTLSNRTLLETRFGFNYFSQTHRAEQQDRSEDARHQHRPARRRGPRRARRDHAVRPHRRRRRLSDHDRADDDDAGVDGADAHARHSTRSRSAAAGTTRYNRSVRNQARTTLTANGRSQRRRRRARRPAAGAASKRGALVRPDRAAHEPELVRRLHQRRLEGQRRA